MRAVVIHETGSPAVLRAETVPEPVAPPASVLIRVAAAGVNYADVMARQGVYLTRDTALTFPTVLGTEVAGVVVAAGADSDRGLVGKRVAAFVSGGYAEFAVASTEMVMVLPDEVEMGAATAFLVQGLSASQLLTECGRMLPGDTVLVHAAAGGVGTLAIQIARQLGAGKIIATAGSGFKRELATELGADAAIDYTEPTWPDEVKKITEGRGADVVLDAVGGDIGEASLDVLAPFGRLVVYGVSSSRMSAFAGSQLMRNNQSVIGYWLTSRLAADPSVVDVVNGLLRQAATGALRAVVEHVYSLEDAALAHRAMTSHETRGKVVLTP